MSQMGQPSSSKARPMRLVMPSRDEWDLDQRTSRHDTIESQPVADHAPQQRPMGASDETAVSADALAGPRYGQGGESRAMKRTNFGHLAERSPLPSSTHASGKGTGEDEIDERRISVVVAAEAAETEAKGAKAAAITMEEHKPEPVTTDMVWFQVVKGQAAAPAKQSSSYSSRRGGGQEHRATIGPSRLAISSSEVDGPSPPSPTSSSGARAASRGHAATSPALSPSRSGDHSGASASMRQQDYSRGQQSPRLSYLGVHSSSLYRSMSEASWEGEEEEEEEDGEYWGREGTGGDDWDPLLSQDSVSPSSPSGGGGGTGGQLSNLGGGTLGRAGSLSKSNSNNINDRPTLEQRQRQFFSQMMQGVGSATAAAAAVAPSSVSRLLGKQQASGGSCSDSISTRGGSRGGGSSGMGPRGSARVSPRVNMRALREVVASALERPSPPSGPAPSSLGWRVRRAQHLDTSMRLGCVQAAN